MWWVEWKKPKMIGKVCRVYDVEDGKRRRRGGVEEQG